MAEKSVTLIVLGADRELWQGEGARLQVTDLGKPSLPRVFSKQLKPKSSTVQMKLDLPFDAGQVYGISVDVKKHRTAWQLIKRRTFLRQQGGVEVESKEHIMRLMLVPRQAKSSNLKGGYKRLRERGSPMVADGTGVSETAYQDLTDASKMALLNLEAKLRGTRVNGEPLLSYVEGVRYVTVDRVFLFMRSELKQIVEDSADFAGARGHKAPEGTPFALPAHPDSWKHVRFGAGNLQLSFSKTSQALPGGAGKRVFSVDVDIDLERGLLHVFEWLDNKLLRPDQKTDQAQVYALLFSQSILTDYTLDPLG